MNLKLDIYSNSPIRKMRERLNISAQTLADELGLSQQTIYNYEYGLRLPDAKICKVLIEFAKEHRIKLTIQDLRPDFFSD